MAARSKARKRAVDLLYESDLLGSDPVGILSERLALADPPINDYTVTLVEGVAEHRAHIDRLLSTYSDGWTIERMPGVDRAVLRVGLFELLWADDIPDAVAIDEAVELAKSLSTDESPKFVNGVLGRVLRDQVPTAQAESALPAENSVPSESSVPSETAAPTQSAPTQSAATAEIGTGAAEVSTDRPA